MYKFINRTTKEEFLNTINFNENNITKTDKNQWEITDRYKNKWRLVFISVNQFTIYNDDEPFWVDVYFKGQNVEILQAGISGKKLKSERFLKKFSELAMLISCYFQFNYLKLL
jgi:hypothetical protein